MWGESVADADFSAVLAPHPMQKLASARNTRWFALLLMSGMLVIWGAGLAHAVWGGLNPGKVPHRVERPYPVREVLAVCGLITVEFGLLFAIVRPFSLSG